MTQLRDYQLVQVDHFSPMWPLGMTTSCGICACKQLQTSSESLLQS